MKRQRINSHARERYAKRNQERMGVGRKRRSHSASISPDLLQEPIDIATEEHASTVLQPLPADPTKLLYTSYAIKSRFSKRSQRSIIDGVRQKGKMRVRKFIEDIDEFYYLTTPYDTPRCYEYFFQLMLHCPRIYPYFVWHFHTEYWNRTYDFNGYPIEAFSMGHWREAVLRYETFLKQSNPSEVQKTWRALEVKIEVLQKQNENYHINGKVDSKFAQDYKVDKTNCQRAAQAVADAHYDRESAPFYHALIQYLRHAQSND